MTLPRLVLAASGTAALAAAPLAAQEPRDTVPVLEPVVVSAPRVAGNADAAPYARSVRTAADLPRGTPALALDEMLRGVPGVQIDNRFNYALGERISIRGAGARSQFGVRGVRVLVDGIPATLPDGQTTLNQVDLTSIARVEVLRGAVASLFGNAAGGAILLETDRPPAGPFAATGTVTAGSHGMLRTRASVGGSMGAWGLAASASRVAYDGYRTHSDARNRYATARAQWLGRRDLVSATVHVVDYDARNPGSLSDSLLRADRNVAFRNNVLQRTGESGTQRQGGVQWNRTAGAGQLEATLWGIDREIRNPIPARIVSLDRLATGARVLHRGTAALLSWSVGVERERQQDDRRNHVNDAGEAGALVLDQDERVGSTGAFVQAGFALAPGIDLTAGLRHDRTRFEVDDRFVSATDPDDSGARTLAATSPSGGIAITLPRDVLVYANAGTAFETPTTTELANRPDGAGGFNPELQPQRTVSYEVGARRVARGTSLQLAAYRSFVRDALVPFEVADVPGRQFFRNAGRTGVDGVEASVSVMPAATLRLEGTYTHTDARFREYAVDGVSFDGNRIPGVAPHRAELAGTWRPGRTWLGADVRYQSRLPVNDANSAWSPSHAVTDLRVGVDRVQAGRVRVALSGGVQNVLGARYNASVVVNAFGRRYYEPGPGRTFHLGATLSAR